MESAQITTQRRIEEEYRRLRDEISAEAERLRSDLEEKQGEAAEEDILFRGTVLIEEGEIITEKTPRCA
jgi:DNA-directed RNA polymerase subunit beta'